MIGIVHPDLGIGGAERLVLDVVSCLQLSGEEVCVYTGHHDESHCFKETLSFGKRAAWVHVRGGWFPCSVLGYFRVLLTNIRCAWATICMLAEVKQLDTVIIDQVFLPVIVCRVFSTAKIVFYCHFPDKLLARRASLLRKMYRLPFDALEGFAMSLTDKVVVNSDFTSTAYASSFGRWDDVVPFVLYPTIGNISSISHIPQVSSPKYIGKARRSFFLSINRFERKKRLHSTIIAFGTLRNRLAVQPGQMPYLILAGGYDKSVRENVEHFHELKRLAKSLNVDREILFLPSVSDATKHALLKETIALLYTPVNEHFGITPLESMVAGRPVIACDSGGPCETIVHGVTGLLVSGSPEVSREIGGTFKF